MDEKMPSSTSLKINKYVSKDSTNCLWRVSVFKMQDYFASASNKDLLHKNST